MHKNITLNLSIIFLTYLFALAKLPSFYDREMKWAFMPTQSHIHPQTLEARQAASVKMRFFIQKS